MNKIFLSLLITIYSLSACAQLPSTTEARIKAVETQLAPNVVYGDTIPSLNLLDQMKKYNIKGLSVAVIKDYKIDWAKAYGWADEEEKRPVTTNTRFQAASISKSLNSLGVLKLVQQSRIGLEADINNYLKSWKFPYDSVSKNKTISIANLLSHTAGLSVHGFGGYETTDSIPSVIQILDGVRPANSRSIRSLFAPGTKFQYSGGGTTISQLIVTDVTGRRYEEFMQKEVLNPIGMTNSFFTQPPPAATKELATAYTNGEAVKGKYHVYPEQAAAGLWTTPTDLAKYIIECQLTYEGKSQGKVINREMMIKRMTPYVDSSAALGIFILKKEDTRYFNHNGGNEGFVCNSFGSLSGGNGLVIMVNGDNFAIISELSNSIARVYGWKNFYTPAFRKVYHPSKDTLQLYTGNYLLEKDTISLSICDDGICVRQNGQPASGMKTIFSNATTFTLPEIPNASIKMLFKDGKVSSFELTQNGMKMVAVRVD
ncbi:MAG TPA: serine hydrolase domain-containing protein [Chitinophagaceae bacterium]|jgi:CubicO group peptidase (beta-lactamase class C family)|nr:serine hydrolase domain-containing protein [Chitinophagaceae bacterium]